MTRQSTADGLHRNIECLFEFANVIVVNADLYLDRGRKCGFRGIDIPENVRGRRQGRNARGHGAQRLNLEVDRDASRRQLLGGTRRHHYSGGIAFVERLDGRVGNFSKSDALDDIIVNGEGVPVLTRRNPSPSTREGFAAIVAALGEREDDGFVTVIAIADDAHRDIPGLSVRGHDGEIKRARLPVFGE